MAQPIPDEAQPRPAQGAGGAILAEIRVTKDQVSWLCEEVHRQGEVIQELLELVRLLQVGVPVTVQAPPGEVSPAPAQVNVDLDGPHGDPEVRKDPPRWQGESQAGRRYSDCTPDYLDELASFNDWRAKKDEEKGDPKAKWPRLDAARARGWAARIRASQANKARDARNRHVTLPQEVTIDDVPF